MSGEGNVRACPQITCQSSATFHEGQQVVVTGKVTGQEISDSRTWYEIKYGDEKRYIHESFVMEINLATHAAFWSGFSLLFVVPVLFLQFFSRSERMRSVAAQHQKDFDGLLFAGVLAVGLICGVIGYIYSQVAHEDVTSFIGAAFANLGAGLVGAAVTFALFQSLLSSRGAEAEQIRTLEGVISSLRSELATNVDNARSEFESGFAEQATQTEALVADLRSQVERALTEHGASMARLMTGLRTDLSDELSAKLSALNEAIDRQTTVFDAAQNDSSRTDEQDAHGRQGTNK